MSRIYHNEPLSALVVHTVEWSGDVTWPPSCPGHGFLLEATIKRRSRLVVNQPNSASGNKHRYTVLHAQVRRAHRRQFDSSGREVEPNFSETEKVRTGYLNSSYRTAVKDTSDVVSAADLQKMLCRTDLQRLTGTVAPSPTGCLPLWVEEGLLTDIELKDGDEVRVKTCGDGPFVESPARLDVESSVVHNYAGGEQVGESWTDKVMKVAATQGGVQAAGGPRQHGDNDGGIADEEWGD